MKYFNIYLTVLAITFTSFLEARYFQSVNMNESQIEYADYTFDTWIENLGKNARYYCAYNEPYFDISYKSIVKRVETQNPKIALFKDENGVKIRVDKENFKEFRKVFHSRRPIEFEENRFAVKFFKVKTEDEFKKLEFYDNPSVFFEEDQDINSAKVRAAKIENPPFQDQELYYAYSIYSTETGREQYVLLGSEKRAERGGNNIVGWVKFIQNNEDKVNVVLWNTNMGIKPNCEDVSIIKPCVFKKTELGFDAYSNYLNGDYIEDEQKGDIIRFEDGVKKWCETNTRMKGGKMRDLPIYLSQDKQLEIGVVTAMNDLKQDLKKFETADEIQIALVLDATNSMSLVWDKLHTVLETMLAKMTDGNFKNMAGKVIEPKIKIYYYNYHVNRLMKTEDWLSSPESVKEYTNSFKNKTGVSKEPRPDVIKTISNLVLPDMGDDHTYIVLIGDASDNQSKGTPLLEVESIKAQRQDLDGIYLGGCGVRIESDIVNMAKNEPYNEEIQVYQDAYSEFSGILDVVYEVSHNELNSSNPTSLNQMGETIASVIENDIMETMEAVQMARKSGSTTSFDESLCADMKTDLSCEYLRNLHGKGLLGSDGKGSFFSEGIAIHRYENHKLQDIDLYVKDEVMEALINHFKEYQETADSEGAKYLIRAVLATFFEIDAYNVDMDFLNRTTLATMWEKVVGNKDMADQLAPELFNQLPDMTFGEISSNIEDYEEVIEDNAGIILQKLTEFYYPKKNNYYIEQTKEVKGVLDERGAYWVRQQDLDLFKGIKK